MMVEECYRCHTPETHTVLFDVVLPTKMDKVCVNCAHYEEHPIFKDASFSEKREKFPSVHERLVKMSGMTPIKKQVDFSVQEKPASNLREIIKAAASKPVDENLQLKKELIENFHWVIMRARRLRHLTKEQLAENIGESFEVIESVEAGNAPTKREVINKLENYLRIKIRKENDVMYPNESSN